MPIVTEDGCCCGLRRVDAVLNLDVVPAASGSAYLEFRDTKIICSVYVPSLGRPSANPGPLWGGGKILPSRAIASPHPAP